MTQPALGSIEEADAVFVSSISAFEIAHKYAKGGIELPCDPEKWFEDVLEHHNVSEIHVDATIAIAATKLPRIHGDPCDRFIIATAALRGLHVVTADNHFAEYGVTVIY